MSDDIVERLGNVMDSCPHRRPGVGSQIMPECDRCEVELEAGHEIARLRAAGDELLVCTFAGVGGERLIAARKAWKEARRG